VSGRYGQWRRLVGDTERPDLLDLGKKLLGYLDQQQRLGAPPTLTVQRELPDGSRVRARFVYGTPIIEVLAGRPGEGAADELEPVQGFVARPNTAGHKGEVLLSRSRGTWNNRFYQLPPADLEAPTSGQYKTGRRGVDLFADGLLSSGNLDWRNRDESFVVSFFGPCDRYFNQEGNGRTPYSRFAFINGDCVLDIADLPATSDFRDVLLGAGVTQAGELVWAVARSRIAGTSGPRLRLYRAPLTLRVDDADPPEWTLAWAQRYRARLWPRYAKVTAEQMSLFFETTLADSGSEVRLHNRHPFVFNQSCTEGRMLAFGGHDGTGFGQDANAQTRELVVNFADGFDAVTFTNTQREGPLSYTTRAGVTAVTGKLDAVHVGIRGVHLPGSPSAGDPYTAYWWHGANSGASLRVLTASWVDDFTTNQAESVVAVDYKDDAPVYAWRLNHQRTSSATYLAEPSMTPVVAAGSYGGGFDCASDVTVQLAGTALTDGLRLPWAVAPDSTEIRCEGSTVATATGSSSGEYRNTYDDSMNITAQTVAVSGSGSYYLRETASRLVLWHLDLRTDSAVWSTVEVERVISTTMAQTTAPSGGGYLVSSTHSGTDTITKALSLHVHLRGQTRLTRPPLRYYSETSAPEGLNRTRTTPPDGDGYRLQAYEEVMQAGVRLAARLGLTDGLRLYSTLPAGTYDGLFDAVGYPPNVIGSATPLSLDTEAAPTVTPVLETMPYTTYPSWSIESRYTLVAEHMHRLYGDAGPAALSWARVYNASHPDAPVFRVFGYWQVLGKDYAFSMPWPGIDGAEGWQSVLRGGDLAVLDGAIDAKRHYPIFLTTRFQPGP